MDKNSTKMPPPYLMTWDGPPGIVPHVFFGILMFVGLVLPHEYYKDINTCKHQKP